MVTFEYVRLTCNLIVLPLLFWLPVVADLGRLMLVVVVIDVDAYPFLVFSDMTCHNDDTRMAVFCLYCEVTPTVFRLHRT